VFAQIARQLQAETDPEKTQERVTRTAVEMIDGCDHAAISLIQRGGKIRTVAATDEVPTRGDEIQYETGEGPCLNAIAEHETFLIDDLGSEGRWPRFSARAAETGVASMLSFRLVLDGDTIAGVHRGSSSPRSWRSHRRFGRSI
jgi:GAF domain-containing protein